MVRLHSRVILKLLLAALLLASCVSTPRLVAQPVPQQEQPTANNPGYPVDVDGQEILRIFESVGSFSAEERANGVSRRLQKLVNDPSADLSQIKVVDTTFGTSIELGDNVLLVITDNDAHHLQVSRTVMAAYYLKRIRDGIAVARLQHSKEFLIWAAVYATVTLAIYLLLLWMVIVGFRHLLRVMQPGAAQLKGIKIQQTELLEGQRLAALIGGFVRALRVVLIIVLTWIFLATEFKYFPWTREHGKLLLNYIITPVLFVVHGFVNYLPNLFYIIVIVAVMVYVDEVRAAPGAGDRAWQHPYRGLLPGVGRTDLQNRPRAVDRFYRRDDLSLCPGREFAGVQGRRTVPRPPGFPGIVIRSGERDCRNHHHLRARFSHRRLGEDWRQHRRNQGHDHAGNAPANHPQRRNHGSEFGGAEQLRHELQHAGAYQGLILHTSVTIGYEVPWRQVHGLLTDAARTISITHPLPVSRAYTTRPTQASRMQ